MNTISHRRASGFTLLEVLVALVVLSIGLLGLSGLQTTGLRNNHSAFLRSQATLLSNDILDRMRANREAAFDGDYDIDYADSAPAGGCSSNCSAQEVARSDVAAWITYLTRMPDGGGAITVDSGGLAEIRVRWNDSRDGAPLELVTGSQL